MNLKATIFSVFSFSIFAFAVWMVILLNIDPLQSDALTYAAFLASLFLWLAGFVTIAEYYLTIYFNRHTSIYAHFPSAVRHGLLASFALTITLALQLLRVLNLFDAIIIILVISLSELYFRMRTKHA